jgi:hypothetical protein
MDQAEEPAAGAAGDSDSPAAAPVAAEPADAAEEAAEEELEAAWAAAHPEPGRQERRFELVATILLSFTALVTAWGGYQASLWDGIQSSKYMQATAARTEASLLRTEANQQRLADLDVFTNYVDARLLGEDEVATFYRERFRPQLEKAFVAWESLDPWTVPAAAPASPLAMPEYEVQQEFVAQDLEERAEILFQEGEDANRFSDIFTLGTLLFATTLFFAGISERFHVTGARITLLLVATIALLVGIGVIVTQPITTG